MLGCHGGLASCDGYGYDCKYDLANHHLTQSIIIDLFNERDYISPFTI